MPVTRQEADYQEKTKVTEFIGNPLLAALQETVSQSNMLKDLLKRPPYREADRELEPSIRLDLLSRINTMHIPYAHDLFIARNLSRCINWGYVSRNPMPFEVTLQILEKCGIDTTRELENYLTRTVFPIYGFSVLGISGVGKSSSVLNALMRYPQIIEHKEYNGVPFHCLQLVWLKVDCPGDGSPKGLCTAILRQIDSVLGTAYQSELSSRTSKDVLTNKVSQCLRAHHLGVLVIDDIQNLCGVKKDTTTDLLSFLIYLMETLAIPVVMVGTPKVLPLFQQEFQLAKRATGDGTVRMGLLVKDSKEWERFISGIWAYQFTRRQVPLTSKMKDLFYQESVGNPFLCALLYKLVQDDAITSGEESFTLQDVRKVANDKLCITTSKRNNMLAGNDEELRRYEYLWEPVKIDPILDDPIEDPVRPYTLSEEQETVDFISRELVRMFKINLKTALKIAKESVLAKSGEDKEEILGFAMKLCRTYTEKNRKSDPKDEHL